MTSIGSVKVDSPVPPPGPAWVDHGGSKARWTPERDGTFESVYQRPDPKTLGTAAVATMGVLTAGGVLATRSTRKVTAELVNDGMPKAAALATGKAAGHRWALGAGVLAGAALIGGGFLADAKGIPTYSKQDMSREAYQARGLDKTNKAAAEAANKAADRVTAGGAATFGVGTIGAAVGGGMLAHKLAGGLPGPARIGVTLLAGTATSAAASFALKPVLD